MPALAVVPSLAVTSVQVTGVVSGPPYDANNLPEGIYFWPIEKEQSDRLSQQLGIDFESLGIDGHFLKNPEGHCVYCGKTTGLDDFVHDAMKTGIHDPAFIIKALIEDRPNHTPAHELHCARCDAPYMIKPGCEETNASHSLEVAEEAPFEAGKFFKRDIDPVERDAAIEAKRLEGHVAARYEWIDATWARKVKKEIDLEERDAVVEAKREDGHVNARYEWIDATWARKKSVDLDERDAVVEAKREDGYVAARYEWIDATRARKKSVDVAERDAVIDAKREEGYVAARYEWIDATWARKKSVDTAARDAVIDAKREEGYVAARYEWVDATWARKKSVDVEERDAVVQAARDEGHVAARYEWIDATWARKVKKDNLEKLD